MSEPLYTSSAFTAQLLPLDDEAFDRAERLTDVELDVLSVADHGGQLPTADLPMFTMQANEPPLPIWYMPAIATTRVRGWYRPVVIGLVAVLLALEALGLCSIFGQVVVG